MADILDGPLGGPVELCAQEGCPNVGRHPKHRWFFLSYENGKAVQEILNRYIGEELREKLKYAVSGEHIVELNRDIDYITGLAKLFD